MVYHMPDFKPQLLRRDFVRSTLVLGKQFGGRYYNFKSVVYGHLSKTLEFLGYILPHYISQIHIIFSHFDIN